MKKILIPISGLFLPGLLAAQASNAQNYIQTRTYLEPVTTPSPDAKQLNTVQYFDGLGRPKQIVNVKSTPLGKDLVTTIPYDGFGRQVDSWLPAPMATLNGGIQSGVDGAAQTYHNDTRAFTHQNLENSPLDRVLSQVQPGTPWQQHPVQFDYDANVSGEVKKYIATFNYATFNASISLSATGYTAGQLYKNTVTDEDGNQTIEFKNGQGKVLMVRKVISATENADTYYVYNDYNQLAFVIPPKASVAANPNTVLDDLCYQYKYDGKNRLVEKKLPGKGVEYMVYDKADRLILTQDTVLKGQGKWMITKYDQFGRVAYTGIIINSSSRQGLQDQIADSVVTESRNTTGFTVNGMKAYYTNVYFGVNILLSVNYYDTYPSYDFNPTFPANIIGQPTLTDNASTDGKSTKGLPVMSLVKNIEDDNWTKNYTYYDKKGRTIGTYSINHLGGYTKTESLLNFAGLSERTNTYHLRKQGEAGVFVTEGFVYDNQNRLLQHYHKVDDKPEVVLADNTYNELSQLITKSVGNNLQSIDYDYNIRCWMTGINKNQMALPDLGQKLFSYKIKYTEKEGIDNPSGVLFPGKFVTAKYNGNIAEVDWRSVETLGQNPTLEPKRYGYAYDKLNRLSAGYYQNPYNPFSIENTESVDYDLNGNITNLYRTGVLESGTTAMAIDRLEYFYSAGNNSNRLLSITDHQNNPSGYEGGNQQIGYDLNGNMTSMPDKGISNIDYNFLNLPNKLDYSRDDIENVSIATKYAADGMKLQKQNTTTIFGIGGYTTSKRTTDYLDGFQYLKTENLSNPGTGGGSEGLMASETAHALERMAFTVDDEPVVALGPMGVKTADLQFFSTAEGFYDYVKDQYIYQYKDHLGNVRVSYGRTSTGALELVDANDYYPFGMNHLKSGTSFFGTSSYKNYKYNGKELQESGMYDYGARMYMSDIGRWGVVDPLSEKNRRFTPYNYAVNNPIMFIDPDGRSESDWIRKDGKWQYDAKITTLDQAQHTSGVDGFAKNGTILPNISVDGAPESAYVQLNEGGSITKLVSDEVNLSLDMFSYRTWEPQEFQSFTGGVNETDPSTASKAIFGDKLTGNNMLEMIFSFYGRNTQLSRGPIGFEEAFIQFGLDIEGLAGLSSSNNDSLYIGETLRYPGLHDTVKKVPKTNELIHRQNFRNKVDSVNKIKGDEWHKKAFGW